MLPLAYVLAGIAALVHFYIFRLESLAWTDARTRAVFGTTPETAAITRPMAFNQGFYNLFLALVTLIGVAASATGSRDVGTALMYAGCGSMLAAALVLATSDRSKLRPALIQGVAPALAVLALLVVGAGE